MGIIYPSTPTSDLSSLTLSKTWLEVQTVSLKLKLGVMD